jgi:hypothetical protein
MRCRKNPYLLSDSIMPLHGMGFFRGFDVYPERSEGTLLSAFIQPEHLFIFLRPLRIESKPRGETTPCLHVQRIHSRDPSTQPHDLRRPASVRMTGFEEIDSTPAVVQAETRGKSLVAYSSSKVMFGVSRIRTSHSHEEAN